MAESDKERLASARAELADLRAQAEDLEEEANALRRRLQDAPKRVLKPARAHALAASFWGTGLFDP